MAIPGISYKAILSRSIVAAEALLPYRFVKAAGVYSDEDEEAIGVTEIGCDSGDDVNLIMAGTAIVETTGSITKGAFVQSEADGKCKTYDTATGNIHGIALTSVTGAGYVEVLLSWNKTTPGI